MRILERRSAQGSTADLILGTGLVGDAVVQAARLLPNLAADVHFPTAWEDPSKLRSSLVAAAATLHGHRRVRLFWCAGRAAFGSSAEQCAGELEAFEVVLDWAVELSHSADVEFHLTSSAGGLHEGQLLVSAASSALVQRPYGELKLQQERALHASALASRFVYRLSSVYGTPLAGRRMGLVSALVLNALQHRSTQITANSWTQRDFVSAYDVGTFMAQDGKTPTRALHEGVHYLVSGLPLSIWALQLALERHLFTRVPVHYTTGKDNFQSTTFSPSLRPAHWSVSSVESNLPRLVAALQTHGR